MCIIAYKPKNVTMPEYKILRTCFENNSDGAGFMFNHMGKVRIEKGFMEFDDFYKALKQYKSLWETSAFVLHFRISTQGGVNKPCCHPFPLSSNMERLKKLKQNAKIGVAHNGIISLTSQYGSKTVTWSDTMEFIVDYLSCIIQSPNFYQNARTLEVIERLAGSKLAILDYAGHCTLIGNFEENNGVFYSNSTYEKKKYTYLQDYDWSGYYGKYSDYWKEWEDWDEEPKRKNKKKSEDVENFLNAHYDEQNEIYCFTSGSCPVDMFGTEEYCRQCWYYDECWSFND